MKQFRALSDTLILRHTSATRCFKLGLPQGERDLPAREIRRLHAKSAALVSFDFAGFPSFSLERSRTS
ncbi:hypothetical protein [Novosphingobium colocasiae]|uniref:hypothetical protein n=1 Tax=Novosphingobium colocasiae TaxID=1256513 RepID=UPI00167952EC|nr:hypothetical protein [Novosphingobium colocasiae]